MPSSSSILLSIYRVLLVGLDAFSIWTFSTLRAFQPSQRSLCLFSIPFRGGFTYSSSSPWHLAPERGHHHDRREEKEAWNRIARGQKCKRLECSAPRSLRGCYTPTLQRSSSSPSSSPSPSSSLSPHQEQPRSCKEHWPCHTCRRPCSCTHPNDCRYYLM